LSVKIKTTKSPVRLVDQLGASPSAFPKAYAFPISLKATMFDQLIPKDLQLAQDFENILKRVNT